MRFCSLLLVIMLGSVALHAQQDPLVGTWKLNLTKSQQGDRGFRSRTSTYEPSGPNGVKLVQDGVTASGEANRAESTGIFDGREYPVANNAAVDTVVNRRIDAHRSERVQSKQGKLVNFLERVISPDGRLLTVRQVGIDAQGKPISYIDVYDRQ